MTAIYPDDKKVAIITGAARGIGSWLACHLHRQGYRVAVCDINEKDGREVAVSLDTTGESAMFVYCDVKSYMSQQSLFKKVWEKWERLDVLVANAGCVDRESVYHFGRRHVAVHDLPPEPDLSCTDIDFKGVRFGTILATHFMRFNAHGKGGKIIVTGSMIGVGGGQKGEDSLIILWSRDVCLYT